MRWALSAVLALAMCSAPAIARAQGEAPPADAEPPSAVQLGRRGLERFEQGAFAESFDLFSRAESTKHSPVFLLYMARSARHLGRLIEARDLFRRASASVPEGSPPSWQQARADANGELAALAPRVPSFRVRVVGETADVALTVDGVAHRPGTTVEHDPGRVTVRATRPAGDPIEKVVVLKEGERDVEIVVDLGVDLGARPSEEPTMAPSDEPGGGTYVPGAIVLGLGGAGLVVGSVFGIVAVSQASDALEPCRDDVCPRSQEPAVEDAGTPADISTVAFIAGGVLAATGVVLLLTLGGDDDAHAASLELGPTHLRASTSF